MAKIRNLSNTPVITLHGSDFVVGLDSYGLLVASTRGLRVTCRDGDEFVVDVEPYDLTAADICELWVTCDDDTEFSVKCRSQLGADGKQRLVFALPDIRIPSLARAQLVYGDDSIDISDTFLRYQLDKNKLNDNAYITGALFNASARAFSSDDLFIVTYAYLNVLPLDNPNFGGLITLLSYRITDKLDDREHVINEVYTTYRRYLDVVQSHDAVAFRWLVSSSSALVTALLSIGSVTQAADVVDSALKAIIHPSFNPLAHQNYALLLFQGGLIKAWKGRFDEAASLFIAAVNAGRHGMSDLLHPQNSWVLGQLSDCYKFLHIIEAAHCAALACTRNHLPPQARFAALKTAPKLHINFGAIFDRFACFKKQSPPFFEQVLHKMQVRQDGR
ncbi:MAG: hypothetical protein EPN89_08725 [Methylovulum sp.]|nr:MAG: hypothetical protein EPN89_08725 [Methylovulum sp.]